MRTALIVFLAAGIAIAVAASPHDGKSADARVGPVAGGGGVVSGMRNDPGEGQSRAGIPLSHSTFVQHAGETVLLTGQVDARQSNPCTDGHGAIVEVDVTPPGTALGKVFYDFDNETVSGDLTTALPPPAHDTKRRLSARVTEDCQDAQLLVRSLRVQVVRFRP